ncbi:AAA family ATPase [Pseudomonas cichorii]|nr:AAA domain-containing protein [Pseudomonas cichorii]MBX8508777.1 AAA family ATPase [Pseudomonas cichorii]MBX8523563.1 AAA family ATPase [Pseudomonas cichorii]MBX8547034.1 AAA family ATPase [Pseudomonas cichorii]MBX8551029.1 AAA family ATPase [Pseudomonas cichorii]MBX8558805.1 AAA family ATPase [Pseudomonas cichorii]
MNEDALKFAKYWRNSLVDAENGSGGLKSDGLTDHIRLPFEALQSGYLGSETVESLFKDEPERSQSIEVTIRPWVFRARLEHGKVRSGMHAIVTPLIGHVRVNRHGQLFPTANTVIPRDILDPLESGSFSLGDVADVDTFLAVNTLPAFEPPEDGQAADADEYARQWAAYLQFCEHFLEEVSPGWLQGDNGYERSNEWCLFKEEKISGASQHIVRLYDHIRDTKPGSALFERYASQVTLAPEPCLLKSAGFAARLGHASDQYALADEQRDALAHFLASRHGDILGVNGPPGTGKTTLLLSVVASLWAEAALAQAEPPVIVASSTNNQAVTNILDAFGSDFAKGDGPFAGRWLPDIDSFGAYFASASANPETVRKYQSQSFFAKTESSAYLTRAQGEWLSNAALAFAGTAPLTVDVAVKQLHQALEARANELRVIEQSWDALVKAREALRAEWGDDPDAGIERARTAVQTLKAQSARFKALETSLRQYLADEPLWYVLFAWIAPVQQKRRLRACLHIERSHLDPQTSEPLLSEEQLEQLSSLNKVSAISDALVAWHKAVKEQVVTQEARLVSAQALLQARQQCLTNWQRALLPLELPADAVTDDMTLSECDALADTRIRFPIFLLSTHYWEGRWLLELEQTLPDILKNPKANGRKALEKRWHRWMKLTPCVVSTFFMLPSYLKGSKYNGSGYDDDYMYELIDLLIVDEAGQVLPEVAGASFALAKKALVIGDTLQIEPIWSIPDSVDIGNLMSAGLLPRFGVDQAYETLCATGVSAASGSVMRIAQNASRYHYDPVMARGMFLYEHRRCYDSIVDYCNALCYQGKLVPVRGEKPQGGLPALGYLHVDGICQQQNGRSRMNRLEAETIAQWLVAHRSQLEERYGQKELWEIVGIITPFGAQSQAIAEACDAIGIKTGKGDGELTVGTVHSFQGAARPVVIFSAVYSKHANGGFIDRRSSMLNVAVSRAKDSFLVFGDMDLFCMVPETKPRGLLAEYLLRDPASELIFKYQPRKDLQTSRSTLSHLINAPAHDQFLLKTLATATREVHIVSPWIILQRIHDIGAWQAMSDAVARGIKVKVYTDRDFNLHAHWENNPDEALKQALQALRGQKIESHVVRKVHSKIVMADDQLLCMGSFNWFSANRGSGANYETSMVYQGPDVASEIGTHRQSLAARIDPVH